jgi:tRNA-Thr(GGU) m(6)t(6)A37 methyltransferase TsaA
MPEIKLKPVGLIRNDTKEPSLLARHGDLDYGNQAQRPTHPSEIVSEIIIDESYAGILDGIEEFSHLLVLYWAHLVEPEGRSLTRVHPMGRNDLPLVGVFSTCSPDRPNPILVIAVRLLERSGNILRVEGLDAVDGSPVLDIKPYLPSYYAAKDVKLSDWMNRILSNIESSE